MGPPPALLDRLSATVPGIVDVAWAPTTGSTNADLLALGDDAAGRVRITDLQTAGRGRRGRTWQAPAGTSLMLSVGLRPRLARARWGLLPLAVGSAVIAACRSVVPDVAPDRLGLKWPNDLLLDGVKAAGILAEAAGDVVVVGMGVNVDWRGVERPEGVVATSLAEAAGGDVDRWALLEVLVPALAAAAGRADADPGGVVRRYAPDCATLGCAVVAHGAPPVEGTAVGLTDEGHLRIARPDGSEAEVSAGDVEHLR